jgi:hypothetical protein
VCVQHVGSKHERVAEGMVAGVSGWVGPWLGVCIEACNLPVVTGVQGSSNLRDDKLYALLRRDQVPDPTFSPHPNKLHQTCKQQSRHAYYKPTDRKTKQTKSRAPEGEYQSSPDHVAEGQREAERGRERKREAERGRESRETVAPSEADLNKPS